jgi:signal transduction histidine kinase
MTRRQQAVDVAIALGAAVPGQLEVWAPHTLRTAKLTGPHLAIATAYLLAALGLALRRRAPLVAAAWVAGVLAIEFLAFGGDEGFGTIVPLWGMAYFVAVGEERSRALVGLGLLAGAEVVRQSRDPNGTSGIHTVPEFLVAHLFWVMPLLFAWLLGAYMRTRRLYVAGLHERAERAEREREERAEAAVASERARIARELHDIVAHSMSVIVVQAEAADEMLDRDSPDRARGPVWKIQETGRAALTDMRRMLGVLREAGSRPTLVPQPGIANLELLFAKVRESGLPVELRVDGEPEPLAPGIDLSAYRIVQEALTNALKYAGPAQARVVVRYAPGALELEVSDDGAGPVNDADGGHGLVGMRERVSLFGGELEAGPAPGGGYLVRARLPLEADT